MCLLDLVTELLVKRTSGLALVSLRQPYFVPVPAWYLQISNIVFK
jgi:hypothetical protein